MQIRATRSTWLENLPIRHKTLLAIGSLLVLMVVAAAFALYTISTENHSRALTWVSYQTQLELAKVRRAALTSQAGVRGYLLTQDPQEKRNFEQGNADLSDAVQQLRGLASQHPDQLQRIDQLQRLIDQWQLQTEHNAFESMDKLAVSDPVQLAYRQRQLQLYAMSHRTVKVSDIEAVLNSIAAAAETSISASDAQLAHAISTARKVVWTTLILSLLFGALVLRAASRTVTRPMRRITELMTQLADPEDHNEVVIQGQGRKDEIGAIARALQVFKEMAVTLEHRDWLRSSTSTISGLLQEAESLQGFANTLTAELSPLLQAGVGVFYLHDEASAVLRLTGSYGFKHRKHLDTEYRLGEGLVGQAAGERKTIVLEGVPEDYIRIHSGTGEASPRVIVVLPLILRDRLLGVLELASFKRLSDRQLQLLDQLMPIASLTLENLGRSLRTQALLEQTQHQADELRSSAEQLRQQQEELIATNEELQSRSSELQQQSLLLQSSEEELRVQAEELQASNEELRQKTDTLDQQKSILESLQQETASKADQLAQASHYKSEFLANMSHELRTPLNSLLILSRSLADNREGNLDEEQKESARIIHESGSNLLRLINDILDLSKVEAGKMELQLQEFPINDLAVALRRTFDHVAREKLLDFIIHVDPRVPATVITDMAKLEQIGNNLVGNAFKFTSQGAVTVSIGIPDADTQIPAHLRHTAMLTISVTDTGIGVPEELRSKIFQAFEQANNSTSRQYGGTGLGLAISMRLAELMGGVITLRSEHGRGSTFTLLLPQIAREDVPELQQAVVTTTSVAPPATAGRPASAAMQVPGLLPERVDDDRDNIYDGDTVILAIEDDPIFSRILIDMIRRNGHRALAALDGEAGLQLAERYRPTGIVLDVMLPGMDGWAVLDRLKHHSATRHIPVHFISAVDDSMRGKEQGAVGFLTKPASKEAVNQAFARLLHFASGNPRNLLIVDDDEDSRVAIRNLLKADHLGIDEVDSAETALARLAERDYDCVVLDLGLPGMSGMELLEQLRLRGELPPIVIYSGRDLSREESLKLRQYTDSIVVKGVRSPDRLLDEVSLFLHSIRHAPPPSSQSSAPVADAQLDGRKVLLVDDDMRNLFALSKVMRGWGMQVTLAQNGQKGLDALAEDDGLELVLMDIMMPIMDGYQTMQAIRAQPAHARLPIIALTAKAMSGDREQCLEAGANDYLSKPIDIDKLASILRVWLPH
ncbi:response regulator [Frateuria aurantia]|uniref:histidine kinase n=1 Tax=Frateuria aurantia (strain ATCC 33424 / DSM 6220 / KCTC 2777 / LMG 1558 / NBRC 3245 / NCIMB 13370) TaxID=767434 RepID=H8L6A9_FRAAD|nr:response regulator [Frateuria aurantia]AFC86786.1 signal transduction histidine kinase [Frateuria aurantia DSM 6220]